MPKPQAFHGLSVGGGGGNLRAYLLIPMTDFMKTRFTSRQEREIVEVGISIR